MEEPQRPPQRGTLFRDSARVLWVVHNTKTQNRLRVKGGRTCDTDKVCPTCATWHPATAHAPHSGRKKETVVCCFCRDVQRKRGYSPKQQKCKDVHDAWKREQLENASCTICQLPFEDGQTVESDHIDETLKVCQKAKFSAYIWYASHGGGPAQLRIDLENNGQLLHVHCHREKSRHCQKRKRSSEEIADFLKTRGVAPRTCTKCKRCQPATQYVNNNTRTPKWTQWCQTCRDSNTKSRNNPSTLQGSIRKTYLGMKTRATRCADCGKKPHDFHHVDPTTKIHDLSHYRKFKSVEDLQAEHAKTIPLCKPCHQLRT